MDTNKIRPNTAALPINNAATVEAIRKSSQSKKRPGIAIGKSGQGAMKDKSDPREAEKFDDYSDISPRHK